MKTKIQASLTNFPDEIIEHWLLPFAETEGWPPVEIDGTLTGRWRHLLGTQTNLDYWRNIEWKKEEIDLLPEDFNEASQKQVMQIIESAVFGIQNIMSLSIRDLKDRFNSIVTYFAQHGVFPIPPVLVIENGKYKLLDGNHRVAAYFYCAGYITKSPPQEIVLRTKLKQLAWVGKFK